MYLESIKFKRKDDSPWERGWYIGDWDNSDNSTILDSRYKPIKENEDGTNIWDYKHDIGVSVKLEVPEKFIQRAMPITQ